ncbi:MAG: DUF4265 domain-containing protein [Pseudomonadota bacterium]
MEKIRILFKLTVEDEFPPVSSELLYGEITSDWRAKIDNTPFFAEGIAIGDVVTFKKNIDGIMEFEEIYDISGNKSISVLFIDEDIIETVYQTVKGMGHYIEYGEFPKYKMIAVSVTKDGDLEELSSYLSELENCGSVSYAELCI